MRQMLQRKTRLLARRAFKLGVRLAIALALTATIAILCRERILRTLLPVFFHEVTWLADDFKINGVGVSSVGADHYIYLNAALARPMVSRGKVLYPESWGIGTALTLSGYVFQTIILYSGVLLAWPAARWRAYPLRLLLGLPVLMLLLMLDVPLVLLGILEQA